MHSIFVLGPFVKINLWVGAPGGHSFQVPMFLNGKKVQSETWRDGRKMVCSRIGECKEIKIGWSAKSCGVQSFRRLNSWPIPMSPCQICQCITKVVSWTPLDHQGKQHLLWCAQSRHWRLGSTKYIADVCSLRILRLRFFRKSEKAPKAPLLLQIRINHSFPHSTVPDSADTRWSDCPDAAVYTKRVTRFHDLSPASPRLAGLVMVKWSNSFWSTYC